MIENRYEIELELVGVSDEAEAVAIARGLAKQFAVPVNVYLRIPGRTFADIDQRRIVTTVDAP